MSIWEECLNYDCCDLDDYYDLKDCNTFLIMVIILIIKITVQDFSYYELS